LRAQYLSKAIKNAVYNFIRQNIYDFTLAIPLIPCTWIGSPRSRCPQEKTRNPRGPSGCGFVQWGDMWELKEVKWKWRNTCLHMYTFAHLHIYPCLLQLCSWLFVHRQEDRSAGNHECVLIAILLWSSDFITKLSKHEKLHGYLFSKSCFEIEIGCLRVKIEVILYSLILIKI